MDRALRLVPLLLLLLAAAPAAGATLRPMSTLDGPVVLLSDLFDDAGRYATRVLGPAPAPGERIVVEAPQLAAIARMYGVDWRPLSGGDRAVLERPGRPLPRDSVLAPLRAAIARLGGGMDLDVSLPGFEAPMIPLRATPDVTVEQLDYDAASGRFTAWALVSGEGMPGLRLRLFGQAEEVAEVPVPAHRLAPGTLIGPDDLTTARVPITRVHAQVARETAQAVGRVLRRSAAPGAPLLLADLTRPGVVRRGAVVMMQVQSGTLTATAQGTAMNDAAPGERVRVLNPASHMVVEGEVQEDGRIVVLPGSAPVGAPFTAAQANLP
jgi:flagellar basal body P-ring formation protein FlgA